MPRPKKKPDYDAAQIMKDFMDTVAEAFGTYDDRTDSRDPGLNAVAAEFGITALKARKLLLTAGVFHSVEQTDRGTAVQENEVGENHERHRIS